MAKTTSTKTEQTVDLAALYNEMEVSIGNMATKEFGKYLPWKYYRNDVAEVVKFLCEKHGSIPTAMVRQLVTAVITKRINELPEGGDKVFDEVNRIRVEVTKSELKERLTARLAASIKSTNNGPTVTRNLGMPSNRAWLLKTHGVTFENGMWSVVKKDEQQTQGQTP